MFDQLVPEVVTISSTWAGEPTLCIGMSESWIGTVCVAPGVMV
jgi:hypothetical protein